MTAGLDPILRLDGQALAVVAAEQRREFVRYLRDGPPSSVRRILGRDGVGDPRISVIIPTADGNRGGYLPALLAQLTRQTFQRFEVIVVEGDRRQGRAINTAAAIARGDLLVTMDDDTRIGHDNLLERILPAFDADPAIGIAGAANLVPRDAPWLVRRAMRELPRRSSRLVREITDSDMAEHPCLAIRKDIFYRIGGEHEWIPRGLDPYLRREVRRFGYRVVLVPDAWIHHLLPPTLRGILRQYHRNGQQAAYVQKFFPQFVIDQALDHAVAPSEESGARRRFWRYGARMLGALASGRCIYAGTLLTYAVGYAQGLRAKEQTP
ncbi:MAG TPA: glycosyltransferase [bacterium]|nr:glycosyltransferase [bacterium]